MRSPTPSTHLTWSTVLGPAPLAALPQLYSIPPPKLGTDPAETDLHRLARIVALYLPDIAPDVAAPPSSQNPSPPAVFTPPPGTGINIQRPPGASPLPAGPPPPASAAQTNPPAAHADPPAPPASASPPAATLKRKWTMMYDELSAALPQAVYDSLDTNCLDATARAKLQEAFRKSTSGAIYDPAVGAPFGHQFRLALA